jgi:hypothetical protein
VTAKKFEIVLRRDMSYKVRFTVTYEVEVECERKDLADEVANLNIPEDDQTTYVVDTFEVESIEDENGNEVKT